jgi:ribosomal protein L32
MRNFQAELSYADSPTHQHPRLCHSCRLRLESARLATVAFSSKILSLRPRLPPRPIPLKDTTMAVRHISALSFLSPFTSPVRRQSQRWSTVYQRAVLLQGLPVLSGYIANEIPSFLAGLWESVLRAVPKKKTSHMKKRHRQMAGKALKDVKSLSKCPGCGEPKRSHVLCPTCVKGIACLKSIFFSLMD